MRNLLLFFVFLAGSKTNAQATRIADSLRDNENYTGAIAAYHQLISEKDKYSNLDVGNAYLRMGNCLKATGKNEPALQALFNSIPWFEKDNNTERLAAANKNIGLLYYNSSNYTKAGTYYNKARELYSANKDSVAICKLLNDIALLESENGNTQDAIRLHRTALSSFASYLNEETLFKHLINLGTCYYSVQQTDSALLYYDKAKQAAIEAEDSTSLLMILNNIGDAHKEKKEYDKALACFNEALLIFDQGYGDSAELATIYHNISELYELTGDYSDAYKFAVMENSLNERIYNTEKNKAALELSEKYESDKKDVTIKTQALENRLKNRNLIISLAALGLVTVLGIFAFSSYRKKQKANRILQEQKQAIEKLNTELDNANQVKSKLFSVISHDLRSPISSLYAFLQMQKSNSAMQDTVTRQTEQVLETMEDLLSWSKSQLHQFTPVTEKVFIAEMVRQSLQLSETGIRNKQLTVQNNIPADAFLHTDANMLSVIIRNIITNTVSYAAVGTAVHLDYRMDNGSHQIEVSNTIDQSRPPETTTAGAGVYSGSSGLGHTLIKEFTEKLNGRFHASHNGNIFTAQLIFPATAI